MARVLSGGGIAIIYLSIFASFAIYDLVNIYVAIGLLLLISVSSALLALYYNSMALAVLGIFGAFLAPFVLGAFGDRSTITENDSNTCLGHACIYGSFKLGVPGTESYQRAEKRQ